MAVETPASEINRIRVDRSHPYDFFWGKDVSGHYLLVLRFDAVLLDSIKIRKIILTGITTDIRIVPDTADGIFLITLQNAENADIFFTLCESLIKKTRNVQDVHAAIAVIYSQLERWRTLLSSAKHNRLSAQEVQGLFGELLFLEECIDGQHVSTQAAIEGWQGPKGAPHDFIFGRSAVEIKSIGGSYADSVKISTESQLTTHLETLHLRVIFLAIDRDCNSGFSLNDFILRLKEKIADSDLILIFEERLAEVGYFDIPEYDFPCFSVVQTRTYEVREGFPCITPESLAPGISDVSYCIAFSSIAGYICDSFIPGYSRRHEMSMDIEEFFHDFRQELLSGAEAREDFLEAEFALSTTRELEESGAIEGFELCHYKAPRGMRVDGYWLNDDGISIDLFIVDFANREVLESLTRSDVDALFKRIENFFTACAEKGLYGELEETSLGYGLARDIAGRANTFAKVNFYLLSERLLSEKLQAIEDKPYKGRTFTYNIWDISRLHRYSRIFPEA